MGEPQVLSRAILFDEEDPTRGLFLIEALTLKTPPQSDRVPQRAAVHLVRSFAPDLLLLDDGFLEGNGCERSDCLHTTAMFAAVPPILGTIHRSGLQRQIPQRQFIVFEKPLELDRMLASCVRKGWNPPAVRMSSRSQ